MTRNDVVDLVALLVTNYEHALATDARTGKSPLVELWVECLAPYDGAAVRRAAIRHMARSPYWPKLSDLIQPIAQAGLVDADEAWAQVLAEVRRVGWYGAPTFSDPAVAQAVKHLGWQAICESTQPDVIRGQFRRFFELARDRTVEDRAVTPLLDHLSRRGLALPGRSVEGGPS